MSAQWVRLFFEGLHRARTIVFILLAVVMALSMAYAWRAQSAWLGKAQDGFFDILLNWRGEREPHPDIVILGLDDSAFTLQADGFTPEEFSDPSLLALMRDRFPWDRTFYAHLMDRLFDAGARLVVFDFVFEGPFEGDEAFADALERYQDRVVLGARFRYDTSPTGEKQLRMIYPWDDLLPLDDEGMLGFVNVYTESDGILRRAFHAKNQLYEQLRFTGQLHRFTGDPAALEPDLFSLAWEAAVKINPELEWSPSIEGRLIDYAGSARHYPIIPVEQIFLENRWRLHFGNGAYFRDKIVLVGPLSEIRFKDRQATPMGVIDGVEVQATLIEGLLNDRYFEPLRDPVIVLGLLGLAAVLALGIGLMVRQALVKAALLLVFMSGYVLLVAVIMDHHRLLLPTVGVLIILGVLGIIYLIYDFALEQYERARVRGVLDRYVSPGVADQVLKDRVSFERLLRGKRQPVTIFFSDIRGFTTLTERSDPETLVDQLNEYFDVMVSIVLEEGGTLQKYIGDAIMAVWGDTYTEGPAEDACRAVRAMLRMNEAMKTLNERWEGQPDRVPLAIGAGLNHGEAVVGNIGHVRRMEFTVLGDPVNLAARLESATKQYHQTMLVGETVQKLTADQFLYRRVDRMKVKGKTQGILVYSPLSPAGETPPAWLDDYERGLDAYWACDFTAARDLMKQALQDSGGDALCALFIERCDHFISTHPPPDWDGSWVLTSK